MMSLDFVLLVVLELFVKICTGKTTVELFTSHSCAEKDLRISANDTYFLIWYGQITPKLCSFTFNSNLDSNGICFESEAFNLPHSMGDVKLQIMDNTTSFWNYDGSINTIPRTCLENVYNFTVSILVPSGYKEPNSQRYIALRITGSEITDHGYELNITFGVISFFLFWIVIIMFYITIFKDTVCRGNTGGNRGIPQRSRREYYSIWSRRQDGTNQSSNARTGMRCMLADPGNIPSVQSAIVVAAISFTTGSTALPSYDQATGMITTVPPISPPSYEEVTSQTS